MQVLQGMSTEDLVFYAVEVDKDGEIPSGDNLVILQMEVADRIKQSTSE
jgi:hypothetical protein